MRLGTNGLKATGSRLYEPLILFGNGPLAPGLAWHMLRHGRAYDLVHLQTLPYAHVVYGYLCARALGRPVVITPHIHIGQPETFDLRAFNTVLRGADIVIVMSEAEIPYLVGRGVARERIQVAGVGVRLDRLVIGDRRLARARLGLPEDAFVLLHLGRKEPYKGLPSIFAAFSRLHVRFPQLHLVSAGPPTAASRDLARAYAGLPRWLDLDAVDEAQKLDLLNACDVMLLPSVGESFGIVFLEAWAVGKPVIGARAGAIPWVIKDGEDGLLVPPNDPAGLADAIQRLVCDPDLTRALGAAGQAKVRLSYTVERVTERIEHAYRLAVTRASARSVAYESR